MSGGLPLSALIGRREILDARVGTHVYTLGGSPQPCAAGLAVLDEIERQGLVANAADVGERLLQALRTRTEDCPIVGEVRGQGLVMGLELVMDRVSRSPAPEHARALARRCFELGLVVIVMGIYGNVIELTPPLTISGSEAELAKEILGCALDDVRPGSLASQRSPTRLSDAHL
jgi:4-aminobutyrate aminotransferase